MDATNLPIGEGSELSHLNASESSLDLESLTDKNWLFIKHYLETGDLMKAYKEARYEGELTSAPYQLFKKLKPFIEEIGNMAVTSRLRLVADLNKAMSLPLSPDKTTVSVSEWLRIRKLAIAITPDTQQAPKMSVLVINRYPAKGDADLKGDFASNPSTPITQKDVIDVDIMPD